jgi:hypothetical protein
MNMHRIVVGVWVGLAVGACGKHAYSRDDLTMQLQQYHIDLRWGRLENAAMKLEPSLRAEFLRSWAERGQQAELQNIEMLGVTQSDEDHASVVVMVTLVDRVSMDVRTANIEELWERTDQGWMCVTPFLAP